MSEPTRYKFSIRPCWCVKPENLEGKYAPPALIIEETKEKCGWVSYEDYARLKAEVEELTGLLKASTYYNTSDEVTRLKAEVDAWKEMVADSGVACNERARENQDLENQIERLKAEVERLTNDLEYRDDLALRVKRIADQFTTPEVLLLRAQVERLTKAGDELHAFLINYIVESRISSAYLNKLDDGWNAAKEGKGQP
jgi:hypothetical protein